MDSKDNSEMSYKSDIQLIEIPTPLPRLAIFTRYVPLLDMTDSESQHHFIIHVDSTA